MSQIDLKTLPRLVDISCMRADTTISELETMVALAEKYRFICCYAMPGYTRWLGNAIKDLENVMLGGVAGFPDGANTTESKLLDVREAMAAGCGELDMVMNIGVFKSGDYGYVEDEIKRIVYEAAGIPVKTIIEVSYLTDYEIQKASEISVKAGVSFVKTGTGWADKPTVVEHIKLIKSVVGNQAGIKAAGGIRDLKTIYEMTDCGCSRFGIGTGSIVKIMAEAEKAAGLEE